MTLDETYHLTFAFMAQNISAPVAHIVEVKSLHETFTIMWNLDM